MSIDPTAPTGPVNLLPPAAQPPASDVSATSDSALGSLDYQAFLHLLVTQMKNQDPTNPMDSTEQLAQLASFATVEQGINVNKNLEQVILSLSFDKASAVIGKRITSADGGLSGIVQGFEVFSDGAVAILQDGSRVRIEPGVKVEEPGT